MSQVLGAFGQLDFTMLWPVWLGSRFEIYELFISLIFQFFRTTGNCGNGGTTVHKLPIIPNQGIKNT
jgi:hypothetical protein